MSCALLPIRVTVAGADSRPGHWRDLFVLIVKGLDYMTRKPMVSLARRITPAVMTWIRGKSYQYSFSKVNGS